MRRIVPNFWFNGDAEQAGRLYASAFPFTTSAVTARYPQENLPDFQKPLAGEPLVVTVDLGGSEISLVNADDTFRPNPSVSMMVHFGSDRFDSLDHAREALDAAWSVLAEDGTVLMPLGEYPFNPHYGWVSDQYSVSWQLFLEEGGFCEFAFPSLMFCGPQQNKTSQAIDKYLSLFPASDPGMRSLYTDFPTEAAGVDASPVTSESVAYAQFTLDGTTLAAMDSGVNQPFTFSPGMSLEVRCDDQEQIDHLWDRLSANRAAEQCGWLQDEFGVSWQIVPANMGELMEKPGAYQKLLEMKKIVISDF